MVHKFKQSQQKIIKTLNKLMKMMNKIEFACKLSIKCVTKYENKNFYEINERKTICLQITT